jgi:hypothetical protein
MKIIFRQTVKPICPNGKLGVGDRVVIREWPQWREFTGSIFILKVHHTIPNCYRFEKVDSKGTIWFFWPDLAQFRDCLVEVINNENDLH